MMKKVNGRFVLFAVSICTICDAVSYANETLAPNLVYQTQPTQTLTTGRPLIELPVIRSKGGTLRAQVSMISAGYESDPIKFGDDDVFSSQSPFPNASQSTPSNPGGSQPFTAAYAYQLKAYGKKYPPAYPPPILQLKKGDRLDLDISDQLMGSLGVESSMLYETNFHGHGLHVSPLTMGDNIYPSIQDPGTASTPQAMRVRIQIPKNQESGLNWFHPHKHTQTNQQVYGGLAGLMVIGDPLDPWPRYQSGPAALKQRYIGLQEVNIQKTDVSGTTVQESGKNRLLNYQASNILPITGSGNCFNGQPYGSPACSWQKRVNGQLNPVITIRPGETQVWNIGSIGAFGSFNLAITDGQLQNPWDATLLVNDGNASSAKTHQSIDIKPLPLKLSADPNRMNDLVAPTLIMPGNRLSMAVTAPKTAGTYYLIDGWGGCNSPTTSGSCTTSSQPIYYILATIQVAGSVDQKPAPVFRVKNPNYDLFTAEATSKRSYVFAIKAPSAPPAEFLINGATFGNGPLTQVQIGSIEEWTLINEKTFNSPNRNGSINSNSANHPFHIHQGNFIVTSINGQPVNPYATNESQLSLNYISPRDEVNIPQPANPGAVNPVRSEMTIKFRVEDFPGKYVFHCHILKHEDQGMMVPIFAFGPVDGLRGVFGAFPGSTSGAVNVIDGTGQLTAQKRPFGKNFSGGINTAAALGAAKYYSTFAVSQASKGFQIAVFDGPKSKEIARFDAFASQANNPGQGTSVALGDINGDSLPEIIVGSRRSGVAELRIFSAHGTLMRQYKAFLPGNYPNGINVAAGDVNGDNFDDIIVGGGAGAAPVVTAFSGRAINNRQPLQTLFQFTAAGDSTSGVRVAAGYVAPATRPSYIANIVTTPEIGASAGTVEVWNTAYGATEGSSGSTSSDHAHSTAAAGVPQRITSYTPFPELPVPVQLQTGYVGVPGVPQVFAWSSVERVAATSFDDSSTANTQYLGLTY